MKILIISDTHNQNTNYHRALEKEAPIDLLLHCGDGESGEGYFEFSACCPVLAVAGNNDYFSRLPREREFPLKNHRVFMAHGHQYMVSMDRSRILDEGSSREADIVLFGHTHRPVIEQTEEILLMNPGSLSYPRQAGRLPSYIVLEVEEDGTLHPELRFLEWE